MPAIKETRIHGNACEKRENGDDKMLLLDTSFIVDLLRGNNKASMKFSEMEHEGVQLCTTSLNALELFRGAHLSGRMEETDKVRQILERLDMFQLTNETFDIFGAISATLGSQGMHIGDFDEAIASIAIGKGATVISRDRHFNLVPGLEVVIY